MQFLHTFPVLTKPLPLGEVSPQVTERAKMLTVIQGRGDSIALTKSLLIAAWGSFHAGLALSVSLSLAKAGLRLPASASLSLASCWPRPQQLLPVSATGGGRRRCPQRGSHWQAGPLPTGRPRPDKAQKGGPCLRGQRFLDKRALSSCRWPRQRSTTVPEKIRLCSSRVGLTGTPEAPPLGELSPKVTERARMLTMI